MRFRIRIPIEVVDASGVVTPRTASFAVDAGEGGNAAEAMRRFKETLAVALNAAAASSPWSFESSD